MTAVLHSRKTWFVMVCYLIILAVAATCFTWARYVMSMEGEVYLPQAKSFTASMKLDESLGVAVDELLPGMNSTKSMNFTILNSSKTVDDTQTETTVISETPLDYTIVVYGTGNLPLELTLSNEAGETYVGERRLAVSDALGAGYQYAFTSMDTGLEAVFSLEGGVADQETFTIEFDWSEDSTTATYSNGAYLSSSERYQKEIETLEIRAVIVAGDEGDVSIDVEENTGDDSESGTGDVAL